MRMFFVKHPIISLIMVGMVCYTVVETAEIVTNGKKNKKIIKNSENESIEV